MKFLGFETREDVSYARTIWLFAETLIAEEAVARLFARFVEMLQAEGFQPSGGPIIDAAFGEAPRQCTGRDDNEKIKKDGVPAGWSDKKKSLRTRERWTKKNSVAFMATKTRSQQQGSEGALCVQFVSLQQL